MAIFASPFIRCIQTAEPSPSSWKVTAGVFGKDNHSKICVEPGLVEDMQYMGGPRIGSPYLESRLSDSHSPRVDLTYPRLRDVQFQRGPTYPGPAWKWATPCTD